MVSAKEDLDEIIRHWADRYHESGGKQMVVQMVFGLKDDQSNYEVFIAWELE